MNARHVSEPKGFQVATASAALATLTKEDGARRFLVADEVGLGKTVVARTIIRDMMKGRRTPLVVFYVASNLNIAHQNRAKLLEVLPNEKAQKAARASADRLTTAANPARRPKHERLQLYTLTPDTSVPLYRRRGGFGRLEERALIYRLLSGRFPSLENTEFAAICRGRGRSVEGWRSALWSHETIRNVRELQEAFLRALSEDRTLGLQENVAESISSASTRLSASRFMGSMRSALALAVVRSLRPDLIIYDEFQKFRDLLINPKIVTPDPLISVLRGEGGRGGPALLLLSATPYRPYSSRLDEADGFSHHQEFFELIRFLFGADKNSPKKIEAELLEFGLQIQKRGEAPDLTRLAALRDEIQRRLRPVLSRTERPDDGIAKPDANVPRPRSEIRAEDLRVFKHWVARLQAGAQRQRRKVDLKSFAVPYWLSIPLPIQMLGRGYVAWRHADRKRRRREEPALRLSQRDRLKAPKFWPHPQLRELGKIANVRRLALPWIAPSLPWWGLDGPWQHQEAEGGKLLIFSRFKAVPPALASLLSFGLETSFASGLRRNYRRAGLAQPLQLKANRPTLPALFFPSPTLIAFTDPRRDKPTSLAAVRLSMRRQVGELLRDRLGVRVKKRGSSRPLWKLLPALEHRRAEVDTGSGMPDWQDLRRHWLKVDFGKGDIMRNVLRQWHDAMTVGLDTVTQRELSTLAEFALSGPGVVLGRSLYRFDRTCIANGEYEKLLDASWNGLRPYLNRALFQAALTRRGQTYTKAIPVAVVDGNLESVLDEHLWIASRLDADAISRFSRDLRQVLGLHEGRHLVHEPGAKPAQFQLRCHAAMPFGDAKVTDQLAGGEGRLRTDDLRRAFNSPFWPHVLATTSMGQEGLDFHVWCRQLLHWDLCQSPLDLEQREGRIQRFGGLSVRLALAADLGPQALGESDATTGPWTKLSLQAGEKYAGDKSGLSPWWACPGEKIDHLFVVLPQSRETVRFDKLSHQRWLYRLALGQPHQQDFIENISQLPPDGRQQYALRLSAWRDGKE
jgi:hypothetical protein